MSASSPPQPSRRSHKSQHTRTESDSLLSRQLLTKKPTHNANGTLPPPPGAGSSSEQQHRQRPSAPLRLPSYSKPKRHASFDTPREVPLPSPSTHEAQYSYFSAPMGHDSSDQDSNRLTKKPPADVQQRPENFDAVFDDDGGWTNMSSKRTTHGGEALPPSPLPSPQQIHPYTRPYSLQHSQSNAGVASVTSDAPSNNASGTAIDRSSTASLPLPSQIPFHTLPKVGSSGVSSALAQPSRAVPDITPGTLGSLPEAEERRSAADSPSLSSQAVDPTNLAAWLQSTSLPPERPTSQPAFTAPQPPWLRNSVGNSPYNSPSTQRSSYPFIESDYPDHPSSYATALPKKKLMGSGLPIPPPQPPTILPAAPPSVPPTRYYSASTTSSLQDASSSPSTSSAPSLASSTGVSTDTGLTSPASIAGSSGLHRSRSRASEPPAYAPFLSSGPPPPDSYIEVETTSSEYRLNVKLPGYKRDGITLATKRRRILHVVADSWGEGGGHFERRISFGYDADLVQVRAEFDGEMLKVTIPRRYNGGSGTNSAGATFL